MIVMARDRGYVELLEALRGCRVLIWTCNTCARFCGVGGRESAEDLSRRLSGDGIRIVGIVSSSACCFVRSAEKMKAESEEGYDTVLALCCDIGAVNAGEVTGANIVNPVVTFGAGYLAKDGVPHLSVVVCGRVVRDSSLSDVAVESGCLIGPF